MSDYHHELLIKATWVICPLLLGGTIYFRRGIPWLTVLMHFTVSVILFFFFCLTGGLIEQSTGLGDQNLFIFFVVSLVVFPAPCLLSFWVLYYKIKELHINYAYFLCLVLFICMLPFILLMTGFLILDGR